MENYLLEYDGDLLESGLDIICHQCNCVSTSVSGLAYFLNKKYPFADDCDKHKNGEFHSLGDLVAHQEPGNPIVFNIYGQYYPGHGGDPGDTKENREAAFHKILDKIIKLVDHMGIKNPSIGFPCRIGCNLAGGDWNRYHEMITNFALEFHKVTNGTTHIINKEM